jgi:hypothetical protein
VKHTRLMTMAVTRKNQKNRLLKMNLTSLLDVYSAMTISSSKAGQKKAKKRGRESMVFGTPFAPA